jgi:DNA-binding MarR family transcriptional regulator
MADLYASLPAIESAATELPLVVGQLRRRLRQAGGGSDLSWSQLAVLSRLAKDGAMSTSQLARTESMRPQSMGVLLSGLEQRGLVEREDHPSDRRQVMFALTSAGAASNRMRRTARQEWLIRAISALATEEQRVLVAAIRLLRQLGDAD